MPKSPPRVVIAGTTSGVGKTTVATGIMGALARRGLRVQPFKVGPDYIDPSYHALVTGRPSRNLDSWMLPHEALRELFTRAAERADVAIIEGVMGLFDGHSGLDEAGSTAEVAKLLEAPVVLVLDVSHTARSAAAMVLGFQRFDSHLNLAGVILNRVGSDTHRRWAAESIQAATGLPVVGCLPRRQDLVLPERHLGLVPTAEGRTAKPFFDQLVAQVEESIDLGVLLRIACSAPALAQPEGTLFPESPVAPRARIAVAQDEAFSFYYQDSLDLLAAWGAELAFFSPLHDGVLPREAQGVYLGGGFPELYAAALSGNRGMRESLRQAVEAGVPVYGECGGLMYLLEAMSDLEGRTFAMVGVVPGRAAMQGGRVKLAYLTARACQPSPLLSKGEDVRGHEFHWSELEGPLPPERAAYQVVDQNGRREGFVRGNVLASYIHLHLGARRDLAPNFVSACARWGEEARTWR